MRACFHTLPGQETKVSEYLRDLEGRQSQSWTNLYGKLGPPLKDMNWKDVVLWLEEIELPVEAADAQRAAR